MEIAVKALSEGIAIGRIRVLKKDKVGLERKLVTDPKAEVSRFLEAASEAKAQYGGMYEIALKELGEANAMLFKAYQLMVDDPEFVGSVEKMITEEGVNAEYAIITVAEHYAAVIAAIDDDYMRQRASDVRDIAARVVGILMDDGRRDAALPEACESTAIDEYARSGGIHQNAAASDENEKEILIADELTPAETLGLDRSLIGAFAVRQGTANSHTAILARSMGIPAVSGAVIEADYEGRTAIVDGYSGKLIIDPDSGTISAYRSMLDADEAAARLLGRLKDSSITGPDGRKVEFFANIGSPEEAEGALACGAEGIGLFRTEFLFMQRDSLPNEENQFLAYKAVAETMGDRPIIIRTLDIGADKQLTYLKQEAEENPALGVQAIRLCFKNPDIFKCQLKAIYRASAYGNLRIMYPMITSASELDRIYAIEDEVFRELDEEGIAYRRIERGIMVETPAAVMICEQLAGKVDFLSIGTNDLTQYTLAMDRQNPGLEEFIDVYHPAIMKMIQMTIDAGHAAGCKVGICGELAADTKVTKKLVEMGIDRLSMAPARLLAAKTAAK